MLMVVVFDTNCVANCRKSKLKRRQMVPAACKSVGTADTKDIERDVWIGHCCNLIGITHQRAAWAIILATAVATRHLACQIFRCADAFAEHAHDIADFAPVGANCAANNVVVQHGADFPTAFFGRLSKQPPAHQALFFAGQQSKHYGRLGLRLLCHDPRRLDHQCAA